MFSTTSSHMPCLRLALAKCVSSAPDLKTVADFNWALVVIFSSLLKLLKQTNKLIKVNIFFIKCFFTESSNLLYYIL